MIDHGFSKACPSGNHMIDHPHDRRIVDEEPLTCPNCGDVTKDGELCGECQANEDMGNEYGR